jgi:hypothetical protein
MIKSVLRKLVLPFFVLGLAVVITPSLVRSGRSLLPPLAPLMSAILVLGVVVLSYLGHLLPSPSLVSLPTAQAADHISQSELSYWLSLYEQQPTHRDVLINVARLYQAENNQEKADFFWQKAQESDPNFPLVKTDK